MKLIRKNIAGRDSLGTVTLLPEDPEDLWHAYNLIRQNDILRASAIRKVVTESSGGAVGSRRVHTTLSLKVTSLDFDAQSCELHVSGQVCEENSHVRMGSYHTLDLELNRQFTLEKADGWDSIALEMLKDAINNEARAQIWAVLLGEGTASVWYITDHRTVWLQNINVPLPSKKIGSGKRDDAMHKFYQTVLDTLIRLMSIPSAMSNSFEPKPLLLGSPGFIAQNFLKHITKIAVTTPHKPLLALVPNIIIAHSSSNSAAALSEVLASPSVKAKLANTKFTRETATLDKFYESLRKDDGKAWYGPKEVIACVERNAVGRGGGVLLISNRLFRASDLAERKRWVALVERVREQEGGEVRVLSEVHESGKRLETLGGVAALLTYPIYDLEEEEEEEEEESEKEDEEATGLA